MDYKEINVFSKATFIFDQQEKEEFSTPEYNPFLFPNRVKELIEKNDIDSLSKLIYDFYYIYNKNSEGVEKPQFSIDFSQYESISNTILILFDPEHFPQLLYSSLILLENWTYMQNRGNDVFAKQSVHDCLISIITNKNVDKNLDMPLGRNYRIDAFNALFNIILDSSLMLEIFVKSGSVEFLTNFFRTVFDEDVSPDVKKEVENSWPSFMMLMSLIIEKSYMRREMFEKNFFHPFILTCLFRLTDMKALDTTKFDYWVFSNFIRQDSENIFFLVQNVNFKSIFEQLSIFQSNKKKKVLNEQIAIFQGKFPEENKYEEKETHQFDSAEIFQGHDLNENDYFDDYYGMNFQGNEGIDFDGNEGFDFEGNEGAYFEGNKETDFKGSKETDFEGNKQTEFEGNKEINFEGNKQAEFEGNKETEFEGNKETIFEGNKETVFKGNKETVFEGNKEINFEVNKEINFEGNEGADFERNEGSNLQRQMQIYLESEDQDAHQSDADILVNELYGHEIPLSMKLNKIQLILNVLIDLLTEIENNFDTKEENVQQLLSNIFPLNLEYLFNVFVENRKFIPNKLSKILCVFMQHYFTYYNLPIENIFNRRIFNFFSFCLHSSIYKIRLSSLKAFEKITKANETNNKVLKKYVTEKFFISLNHFLDSDSTEIIGLALSVISNLFINQNENDVTTIYRLMNEASSFEIIDDLSNSTELNNDDHYKCVEILNKKNEVENMKALDSIIDLNFFSDYEEEEEFGDNNDTDYQWIYDYNMNQYH